MAPKGQNVTNDAEEEMDRESVVSGASEFSWSNESSYCLQWLFDPNRIDDLPIEEQLKYYKKRDLRIGKITKIAQDVWKVPIKRKNLLYWWERALLLIPEVFQSSQPQRWMK